ncbi:hypothetical protein LB503_005106 [Fusarium chuoi]|nr:hypothetical protein LB503_005106 [Fusarium chuoi]
MQTVDVVASSNSLCSSSNNMQSLSNHLLRSSSGMTPLMSISSFSSPWSAVLTEIMTTLNVIPSPWFNILLANMTIIRSLSASATNPSPHHALFIRTSGLSAGP